MKIRCDCGHIITDNTDFIPYKAYFTPDEDWFDTLNAVRDGVMEAGRRGRSATDNEAEAVVREVTKPQKLAYQCTQCGRLYFDGPGRSVHIFKLEHASPEDQAGAKALFRGLRSTR